MQNPTRALDLAKEISAKELVSSFLKYSGLLCKDGVALYVMSGKSGAARRPHRFDRVPCRGTCHG